MADAQLVVRVAANLSEFRSNLAEGVTQIETYKGALQRASASFDGSRIVQQASAAAAAIQNAGGVTTLTRTELERANLLFTEATAKLELMGKGNSYAATSFRELAFATKQSEVATNSWSEMQTYAAGMLAGTITMRLAEFARQLFDDAGRLQDLTERTGISVEALQRFKVIAEQSGATIDSVATAVFQMGKRLAGGDESAAAAVRELGLDFDALRKSSPEQAFETIGKAIGNLEDPFKQSELGARVFGKSVAELIPTFKHLDDAQAPFVSLSKDQVQFLDDLGDAWTRVKSSIIGFEFTWMDTLLNLTNGYKVIQLLRGELGQLPAVTGRQAESVAYLNKLLQDALENGIKPVTDGLTHQSEIERDLSTELKRNAEIQAELNSAGATWQKTLEGVNGNVVEAVKYYLQAGVAQGTLADAYALTAVQVKAVSEALKEEAEIQAALDQLHKATREMTLQRLKEEQALLKERNRTILDSALEIRKIEQETADFIAKETLSSTDYQLLKIKQEADARIAAFKGSTEQLAIYTDNVRALAQLQTDAIIAAASRQKAAIDTVTLSYWAQIDAAARAAGVVVVGARPGETTTSIYETGAPITARASGGPVSANTPYVVGELGPELFVPSSSGTIVPNGAGGTTVNIHITQPLGTPTQIAQVIGDALMSQQRALGVRFPTMTGTSR